MTAAEAKIPDDLEWQYRRPGRWGVLMASVWLFYLFQPLSAGWQHRDSTRGWLGMALVVAFGAVYVGAFAILRARRALFRPGVALPTGRRAIATVGLMVALGVGACVCVGQTGTACAVYVAVVAVLSFPRGIGWAISLGVGFTTYAATALVPGWKSDLSILFGTMVATLAVWGIQTAISRNFALIGAQQENAELAVVNERNRFARDLHDILGHSLTVITVKAELAHRLMDVDLDRAKTEVEELEQLSRDALADVRRAVEGYRELSLSGELARARTALAAAEIRADLPNTTDDVVGDLRELFAWVVREGVTNVIRHSGASSCQIHLSADSVSVVDDGKGSGHDHPEAAGHGLIGLRERAAARDATVITRDGDTGFSLQVVAAR